MASSQKGGEEVPLKTTYAVRSLAGREGGEEAPAVVRVQNLQCVLQHAGHDAWNRSGKTQPCLISAEICFSEPFALASASDRLGEDTVHYGSLSKALLASVAVFTPAAATRARGTEEGGGVQDVLGTLWRDVTGREMTGEKEEEPAGEGGDTKGGILAKSLASGRVSLFSLEVFLPKASLLGEGVRYTATAAYDSRGRMVARAMQMGVLKVRVPVLIGVNANEREARQMLMTTVFVDEVNLGVADRYAKVEGVLTQALQESAFETLEALGTYLIDRIEEAYVNGRDYHVHVRMEKPIAVPLADCPIVEVRRLVKDYYR